MLRQFLKWPAIITSTALAGWSITAVAEMEIAIPDRLITSNAYAFSRNPMYVGWTVLYMVIALVASDLWMVMLLALALFFLRIDV